MAACDGLWQRAAAPKGGLQAPILQIRLGGLDPGGLEAGDLDPGALEADWLASWLAGRLGLDLSGR